MVLAEVTTGLAALKGAYEIAKGLMDIDDQVRLNAAIIELQQKILTAQEGVAVSRAQLEELRNQISAYQQWDNIAARYKLKDFGEGTYAYQFIIQDSDDSPEHLACPNCFQRRERSILQYRNKNSGRRFFTCPACEKTFGLGAYAASQPRTVRSRVRDF